MGQSIAIASEEVRSCIGAKSSDREKFEQIALKLSSPLMAVAIRFAHPDRALAEDLVQHAFLTGYRLFRAGRFDPSLGAFSWFSKVIANEFQAHLRRSRFVTTAIINEERIDTVPSMAPDPYAMASSQLLSGHLCQALAQLPDDQRICIELIDLANMEYQDAAKICGVPLGTLKSRLVRGRIRMAELLMKQELDHA